MPDLPRHLLQSTAAAAEMAAGQPPAGLLHPLEEAQLAELRLPRRRRHWLIGRWAAKHLLHTYLAETLAAAPALSQILIANDPRGAPYAALAGPDAAIPPRLLPLSLSISHTGHWGLAALCPQAAAAVGADIEQVTRLEPRLVEAICTPGELAQVRARPHDQQDLLITALWSGKEAALKALGAGLSGGIRQIDCTLPAEPPAGEWAELGLDAARDLLAGLAGARFRAWQRLEGEFVITLALLATAETGA